MGNFVFAGRIWLILDNINSTQAVNLPLPLSPYNQACIYVDFHPNNPIIFIYAGHFDVVLLISLIVDFRTNDVPSAYREQWNVAGMFPYPPGRSSSSHRTYVYNYSRCHRVMRL